MRKQSYDAVIIGFGKAGKTLAAKLATLGKRVALAEQDAGMYGGTCVNVGCIPSKSLIVSAAKADPNASEEAKDAFYQQAMAEKRRLVTMLRQKSLNSLDAFPNVDIYTGKARFDAPGLVEVDLGTETVLLAGAAIFINTGSTPRIPPIPGLSDTPGVYTSRELLDLDVRPRRLTILGGGYIGLEFASLFAAFGSSVTVIQDTETFLPREDEDIAAAIRQMLEDQGVTFRLSVETNKVERGPDGVRLTLKTPSATESLDSDALLVATGRMPNTAGLNCQASGIALTAGGAVQVDELLRTTAPQVWAMGDVAGGLQHTYVSLDDSRIVWEQLTGGKPHTTTGRQNIPYSVFLRTPYARVGLSAREAQERGLHVRTVTLPAAAIPKAHVLGDTTGLLKAVIDADKGRILGAMLLCQEAHETINVIKLAMDLGAPHTVLRDQLFTHPTMTEALNDLFA